jgi:hypothetical protein
VLSSRNKETHMVEYERSETVPASGATVYAYVADPRTCPRTSPRWFAPTP